MPRFFFHIRDGDGLTEDPEGSELPDLLAAWAGAVVAACEIAAERLKSGKALDGEQFDIRDGAGLLLTTVPLPRVSDVP